MSVENFTPMGPTVGINNQSSTSSSATALGLPAGMDMDCLVTHDADVTIFVRFGDSTVTDASATVDTPIKAGSIMVLGIGRSTHVKAIVSSTSASGKIYFTPGKGS